MQRRKAKVKIGYCKYFNKRLKELRASSKFATELRIHSFRRGNVESELYPDEVVARIQNFPEHEYSDLNRKCGGDYIYLIGYKDPIIQECNEKIDVNNRNIATILGVALDKYVVENSDSIIE